MIVTSDAVVGNSPTVTCARTSPTSKMSQRQRVGLLWLTLVVMSLWLAEGGLLEEAPQVKVNSVGHKTDTDRYGPLPCITTERSGVCLCVRECVRACGRAIGVVFIFVLFCCCFLLREKHTPDTQKQRLRERKT